MTIKSSISLTDEQHAFAKELVRAGRYSSVSAVLQQGIDLLRRRMEREETETEALKLLLSRRHDGDFITSDEMGRCLEEKTARKNGAHALRN